MFSFTAIPLGETRPISIDTTTCGKPNEPCKLFAKGPTSPYIEIPTKKTPKGYEAEYTPTEAGPNAVKLEYAEREYSKTPFVVNVETDIDEKKVLVQGLDARKFVNGNVIILAYSEIYLLKQFFLFIISMAVDEFVALNRQKTKLPMVDNRIINSLLKCIVSIIPLTMRRASWILEDLVIFFFLF